MNPEKRNFLMKAKWVWLAVLLLVFTGVLPGMQSTLLAQQDTHVWEILGLLNTHRVDGGLSPLAVNSRLAVAAQRHSDDMGAGDFLAHEGSDGTQFWERVADTGYVMTAGAENVLYRWNLDAAGAFQQWWNSPPHRANMMNGAYREVGIAYAVSASGKYYYTMVLATREDYVRPTTTPGLTATRTTVELPTPFASPASTQPPVIAPTATSLPTETPTEVVQLTDTPVPVLSPDVGAAPQDVGTPVTFVAAEPPSPVVYPTQRPYATSPSIPTPHRNVDLRLEYDASSFTLINVANRPVYIAGLSFESVSGAMPVERWITEYLSASLEAFPAGGCLQVWSSSLETRLTPPENCVMRHAWASVNDSQLFWRGAEVFVVYRYGEAVTACLVGLGYCEVDLEERLPVYATQAPASAVGDTSVPVSSGEQSDTGGQTVSSGYDIRLIYRPESFTLLNTSGEMLDLTGLGFSSPVGTLNVDLWGTADLSRPLYAFPAGDCLQAWPFSLEEWPFKPGECGIRHGWIAVNDTRTFWAGTDYFTVSRSGVVLATCRVASGVCDFNLP